MGDRARENVHEDRLLPNAECRMPNSVPKLLQTYYEKTRESVTACVYVYMCAREYCSNGEECDNGVCVKHFGHYLRIHDGNLHKLI